MDRRFYFNEILVPNGSPAHFEIIRRVSEFSEEADDGLLIAHVQLDI